MSANTTPFQLSDPIFANVLGLMADSEQGVSSDETLMLINSSNLLLSLLHAFKASGGELIAGSSSGYTGDDIEFKAEDKGTNFVRILGHELGHFYDHQLKGDAAALDPVNNFADIIKYEMDESQATAISYIIRRQIMLNGGPDIQISNRIGNFSADGVEIEGGLDAEIANLDQQFSGSVTATMTIDDSWTLASQIAGDIWGKNFLTRPGGVARWNARLDDAYGSNIPIFLQTSERTFLSARLLADGQHEFTFKDADDQNRTWVYEATTGGNGRDLLVGGETAGSSDTLRGGGGDDILYGGWTEADTGIDYLYGDAGNDKLYGGGGNDTLIGGIDNDTLVGGGGVDTYVVNDGDGQDTIIDDGRNILMINGEVFAGLFIKNEGSNSYTLAGSEQNITITFGASTTLAIDGEVRLTFANQTSPEDFANHAFGITLKDTAPDTSLTLTGSASRDEMSIVDIGTNPANWRLFYTSFPSSEGVTLYSAAFPTVAPRMSVSGGAGDDFLFGFMQYDEIFGGEGNDILIGDLSSWNGKEFTMSGTLEGDMLDGGSGNDWIQGTGGSDQLIGGDGNDLISGFDEADSLRGDAGNDVLAGGSHDDTLIGGAGDDILLGEGYFTGSLSLTLDNLSTLGVTFTASSAGYYTGYTTTNFTINNDAPNGGDDILLGGAGRDMLFGGAGDDVLDGGTESDSLFGGEGNDWLYGGDGNDWLVGDNGDLTGAGDDMLIGGPGNDLLYGLGGNDTLMGDAGADELYGFDGNDDLFGDSENDYLDGGDGNDILNGGDANDTLLGGRGDDVLSGGSGHDYLDGGVGDDTYVFNLGDSADTVNNNDSTGLDTVSFGAGIALVDLNRVRSGNDLILKVGSSGDQLTIANWFSGAAYRIDRFVFADGTTVTGSELLFAGPLSGSGTTADDSLPGSEGVDIIAGKEGNDTVYGYGGDDILQGDAGNDSLYGGEGNDTLDGGSGNDYLVGGTGNDVFVFGRGNGHDTVDAYEASYSKYDMVFLNDLLPGDVEFGIGTRVEGNTTYSDLIIRIKDTGETLTVLRGAEGGSFYQIQGVKFSDGTVWSMADIRQAGLHGTSADENLSLVTAGTLHGEGGNDILNGSGGNDILYGGDENDTLYGNDGDDILDGETGNDALVGGAGNDVFVFGRGYGHDTVDAYEESLTKYDKVLLRDLLPGNVEFSVGTRVVWKGPYSDLVIRIKDTGETLTVLRGDEGGLYYDESNMYFHIQGVEFSNGTIWTWTDICRAGLHGTGADDIMTLFAAGALYGDGGNDRLYGYTGNDTLYGGEGNDELEGAAGNDILDGGAGDDHLYGGDGSDVLYGGDGDDLLFGRVSNYSYLEGDTGSDVLYGDAGNDYLQGATGDDVLVGGTGNDLLRGEEGQDLYLFGRGDGQDVLSNFSGDRNSAPWIVPDTIRFGEGIALSDIVVSQDGENLLLAISGTGDRLTIERWFTYNANRGIQVEFQDGTVWNDLDLINMCVGIGDPVLFTGTEGNDILIGNDINDVGVSTDDFLVGKGGNDRLIGGDGGDWLEGGDGDDILFGDHELDYSGFLPAILGYWQEDRLYGGSGNDVLYGGEGRDVLYGGEGDDLLFGDHESGMSCRPWWPQEDILNGGSGSDILYGGGGNDTYIFNSGDGADTINDYEAMDRDILTFGEGIALADLADFTRVGNDLVIHVGSNGDQLTIVNWFWGRFAQLEVTFADGTTISAPELMERTPFYSLQGSSSTDYLYSGPGDDFLEGGDGNDYLYGSDGNNQLFGGSGNDILDGGFGDDFLYGGDGDDMLFGGDSDTMFGGAGNDKYYINSCYDIVVEGLDEGSDKVISTISYTLGDNVENLTLIGRESENGTGNSLDNVIVGSDWANYLYGGAGNDILDGLNGDDTLHGDEDDDTLLGGAGDDVLNGGSGSDTLNGGAGNDVLVGGTDNDSLYGGYGDDVFQFGLGDGQDIIQLDTTSGIDTLAFDWGIGLNDIRLVRSGNDLLVQVGESDDQVTLTDWYRSGYESYRLDKFSFADGTVLTNAELMALQRTDGTLDDDVLTGASGSDLLVGADGNDSLSGEAGNDILFGNNGNDLLDGGSGNDTLNGGAGNDTYLFGRGYDSDTIVENDEIAGNADVARFMEDIATDQLWFRQVDNNLEVSIVGTMDTLIIRNWYDGEQHHVEQFETADNKVLLDSQVDALVSAMASFAPPASGQTTLPPEYQAALAPVIAASWQ